MKKVPEKYIKEPTGYPFSPVMSIEGKQIIVTSGTCCDDLDGKISPDMKTQAANSIKACEIFLKEALRCVQRRSISERYGAVG